MQALQRVTLQLRPACFVNMQPLAAAHTWHFISNGNDRLLTGYYTDSIACSYQAARGADPSPRRVRCPGNGSRSSVAPTQGQNTQGPCRGRRLRRGFTAGCRLARRSRGAARCSTGAATYSNGAARCSSKSCCPTNCCTTTSCRLAIRVRSDANTLTGSSSGWHTSLLCKPKRVALKLGWGEQSSMWPVLASHCWLQKCYLSNAMFASSVRFLIMLFSQAQY